MWVEPCQNRYCGLRLAWIILIHSKGFGWAQPIQVVGCHWNRLDEPVFIAFSFLGWQGFFIWKKSTHRDQNLKSKPLTFTIGGLRETNCDMNQISILDGLWIKKSCNYEAIITTLDHTFLWHKICYWKEKGDVTTRKDIFQGLCGFYSWWIGTVFCQCFFMWQKGCNSK